MKNLVLVSCFILFSISVSAQQEVPKFTNYVNDYGNMLSAEEETQLNSILKSYQDSTSNQIAILTLASYDDRNEAPLFDFTMNVFQTWKIGQKSKDNGILLVVVKNLTSKYGAGLRIAVGYGLEGSLPDATCKKIIEGIRPLINGGRYYTGINYAVSEMVSKTKGEFLNDNKKQENNAGIFVLVLVVILSLATLFFFLVSGLSSSNNSSYSGYSESDFREARNNRSSFHGSSSSSSLSHHDSDESYTRSSYSTPDPSPSIGDGGGSFDGGGGGECGGGGAGD